MYTAFIFIYFSKVVSGVQLTNGNVEKADIYILAMGIMANPMGRSIGINLPVYPLKGNIVTVPLKVKHKKKSKNWIFYYLVSFLN